MYIGQVVLADYGGAGEQFLAEFGHSGTHVTVFHELKRRNVLRVAIAYVAISWLLIQIVETLFPVFGLSNGLIRIIVIVLAIGFPLALILSWLYELTPDGFKKDEDVDHSSSQAHHTGKKLDRAIIIVLALSLGYFAFDKFVLDPARDARIAKTSVQQGRSEALIESYGENSIAVLPFVNMSSDPEQEYFSDGISEELLNLLAKMSQLRVISRSSSFAFKGKEIDIPSIAAQLNVAHILEGSVRKAGNKVRITAQLIDARTDTHLWSETYDRELSDIFAIQDEISAAIVGELREALDVEIDVAPRANTTASSEAYEAYLRGRYLVVQRSPDSIEGAMREFEKAIALDPDYAVAHAELAIATLLMTTYGDLDRAEAIGQAEPHVERALALDPLLAEAHAAAGHLADTRSRYSDEQAIHLEKAIELNPNYADAWIWLSRYYSFSAKPQYVKALEAARNAALLDPLSGAAVNAYVINLVMRNRLAEADEQLEKLASLDPRAYAAQTGFRLLIGGNKADGLFGALNARLLDPENTINWTGFGLRMAILGLEKEAIANNGPSAYYMYIYAGNPQRALSYTEERWAENPESDDYKWPVINLRILLGVHSQEELDLWEQDWPSDPEQFSFDQITALLVMRRRASEDADISDLLSAMKESARRLYDGSITALGIPDYQLGLALFLGGDRKSGLELIGKAVDVGYDVPRNMNYLQSLYDDPGFAPIKAQQEAIIERERHRFLTVVCNDNPYAEVWEPEAETCEAFAKVNSAP